MWGGPDFCVPSDLLSLSANMETGTWLPMFMFYVGAVEGSALSAAIRVVALSVTRLSLGYLLGCATG